MIKYSVRMALQGKVWVSFAACLIPMVLSWVLQLFHIDFGSINIYVTDDLVYAISIPMMLLSFLATTFVTNPMNVRLASFFLTLNRDRDHLPSPLSVCDCFGAGYSRLVQGMLWVDVRTWLWAAVPVVIGALLPGSLEWVELADLRALRIGGYFPIFLCVAAILYLYRSTAYMMVPYLLAENTALEPSEALHRGLYLTQGRIFELIIMQLSFYGWLLLSYITLFIGAVYTYPYIEGTVAAYYLAYTTPDTSMEHTSDAA